MTVLFAYIYIMTRLYMYISLPDRQQFKETFKTFMHIFGSVELTPTRLFSRIIIQQSDLIEYHYYLLLYR